MIRFFESYNRCYITIDTKFQEEDIEVIEHLFGKNYEFYDIKIYSLYSISALFIKLLHEHLESKNIELSVNRGRLMRYLHRFNIDATLFTDLKIDKSADADILLIGGSAKSTEKILFLLQNIDIAHFTVIIIQHINALRNTLLDKLLNRYIEAEVKYLSQGELLQKNHIYIAPKDFHLKVDEGYAVLEDSLEVNGARPSISVSFASFSHYYKERLIAILECGHEKDGVDVLASLQKNHSTLIIQDPLECAEADSIPRHAIASKQYNYIFSIQQMSFFLNLITKDFSKKEWIAYLLAEIYRVYEYDFREYDQNMIERRVDLFMIKYSICDIKSMVVSVLHNRTLFKLFFLEISINVSEFFRDPFVVRKIIPILENFKYTYNLKIWCAGVSNGKEAYSIAILLDILQISEKTLIYATDFNPVVIEEAKNALYSKKEFFLAKHNFEKLVLFENLENYFYLYDSFVEVKPFIKEKVMFFVHDLLHSSSFNEFDFIECRNVLIYFKEPLQKKVFKLLYDSLKFGGFLVLGSNEFLLAEYEEKFEIYDSKCKIFKKVR